MSLLEVIGAVGLLSLSATAALSAMLGAAHVATAPGTRDLVFIAARNAAVEARAAAAYDTNAAAAMLAATPASWNLGGIVLQSSAANQTLLLSASAGAETSSLAIPIGREGFPQGAIVDTLGNLLTP